MLTKDNAFVRLILVLCLTVFAYSAFLSSSFKTRDDYYAIIENSAIKDLSNIPALFQSSYFGQGAYYRPLVSLSHAIEHNFFGLNPFFFNLTNLLIHLAVIVSVFLLLKRIVSEGAAFWSAFVFAIHPLHWSEVTNISGRAILLCGLFVLNAFLLFIKHLDAPNERKTFYFFGSLACFALALLSKESACMFVAVLIAYMYFLRRPINVTMVIKKIVPFILLVAAYLFIRAQMNITKVYLWPDVKGHILGILSFLHGTFTYVRLFVVPFDVHFDRSHILFTSFLDPQVWITISFYAIVTSAILFYRKKINPTVLFFLSWSAIELFPVSQTVAAVGLQPGYISLAEHFLYVSAVGVITIIVLAVSAFYRYNTVRQWVSPLVFRLVVSGFLILLFFITVEQSIYARSEEAMFRRALKYAPHNMRLNTSMAFTMAQKGDFTQTEYYFRKVLDVNPIDVRARIGLGKALCDQGRYAECLEEYRKVENAGPFERTLQKNIRLTEKLLKTND